MSNISLKRKDKDNEDIQRLLADAWLNITVDESTMYNPLMDIPPEYMDEPHKYISWLMTRPEYFSFICKEIFNIDLLPFQALMLRELWERRFPMLIATRGAGKSFILGLYSLLRILLMPKRKLIVAGAGFRQSKVIFDYMETIYNNAPLLRDIVGINKSNGVRRATDMWTFSIGESVCRCIPVGDGSKIRGQRANDLLVDEFASLPVDIFENVMAGFAAVSSTPVSNVKDIAAQKMAKKMGYNLEDKSDPLKKDNQIIISGTAYYDFNHFSDYWKDWHEIICTQGNERKLKEFFKRKSNSEGKDDTDVPADFNYEDYSIIRMPFEKLPKGFMDAAQVARSKATIHAGIYMMEFSACGIFETPIITDKGIKPLGEVNIGDKVLTHKGRFRPVLETTQKPYNDKLLRVNTNGYFHDLLFTPNHPFWVKEDIFTELYNVENELFLSNIKELSGLNKLDCINICTNYVEKDDYIYAKSSKNKLSSIDVNNILKLISQGQSQVSIAKQYNVSQSTISMVKLDKRCNGKPKNAIPSSIPLNYDMGICVGYYASEGSTGSNGHACNFALDGHVNIGLEEYVEELSSSLYNVFNIYPKYYDKQDNCISVNINARLVCELFKYICPGNCYSKLIRNDILFSNEEFLKGFIIGMFNGDGHIRDRLATLQLTNLDLVNQVKMALSYFGINASFLKPKREKTGVIKGKEVNLSQAYKINISGNEFRKFMNTFYGFNLSMSERKQLVQSDEDKSSYNILEKELIPFNGFLYNLEVEEDNSYSTPNSTVHNCFSTDSNGFFKRSLIESCVGNHKNSICLPSEDNIYFQAGLYGNPTKRYVYGIDPASQVDNFSIVVLELCEDHRRIVYGWTTNVEQHKIEIQAGVTNEMDYYSYCAKKIRQLMNRFPCERIGLDAQGGGIAIMEALHDPDKIKEGEVPIWPIIDEDKEKDTDFKAGAHIVDLIQFASADWTSEANHGLRKDLEDKAILFPHFDPSVLATATGLDKLHSKIYDTLEDCIMEIEELKDELSTIVITQTTSGRDRWDTPEIKMPGGKKGRMRKDRYSAVIMANMVGRQIMRAPAPLDYSSVGGFSQAMTNIQDGAVYIGNEKFAQESKDVMDFYGMA